jgi:hypothetical protein
MIWEFNCKIVFSMILDLRMWQPCILMFSNILGFVVLVILHSFFLSYILILDLRMPQPCILMFFIFSSCTVLIILEVQLKKKTCKFRPNTQNRPKTLKVVIAV